MIVDGDGYFHQPASVLGEFNDVGSCKKLDPIGRWIAQRFYEARGDQPWHIVRLAIQQPRRLLRGQTAGELP